MKKRISAFCLFLIFVCFLSGCLAVGDDDGKFEPPTDDSSGVIVDNDQNDQTDDETPPTPQPPKETTPPERKEYRITADEYMLQNSNSSAEYNVFDSITNALDQLSAQSRDTLAYAQRYIEQPNTIYERFSNKFLLQNDPNGHTVLHQTQTFRDGAKAYKRISFYDDADGDPTFSYTCVSDKGVDLVLYTPQKRYSVRTNAVGMYFALDGYCENGLWRGLRYNYNLDNPYLTHEGVYDYANGNIFISFPFETDDGCFYFSDRLIAYRDGKETWSNVAAQPDDRIVAVPESLFGNGVRADLKTSDVSIDLSAVEGWQKLCFVLDLKHELYDDYEFKAYYTFGDGDYLETTGGTQWSGGSVWTADTGLLSPQWQYCDDCWRIDGYYDPAGRRIANAPKTDTVVFSHVSAYIDRCENPKITTASANFHVDGLGSAQSFARLDSLFTTHGLNIKNHADTFRRMADLQANRKAYTADVFETVYGQTYTTEHWVERMYAAVDALNAAQNDIPAGLTIDA